MTTRMIGFGAAAALAASLAACGSAEKAEAPADSKVAEAATAPQPAPSASAAPPRADLKLCETYPKSEDEERQRTEPLKLAPALAALGATDMDHIAVTTLAGKTFCVDARFMDAIADQKVSADGRFVMFGWQGYEAYGFQLIDRTGKGDAFDVGAKPVFSPAGKLIAAVELSESGFGQLNGFEVLAVHPAGLELVTRLEDIPPLDDWRIDRWVGEDCIELSGVAYGEVEQTEHTDYKGAARTRYAARPSAGNWALKPSPDGCKAS